MDFALFLPPKHQSHGVRLLDDTNSSTSFTAGTPGYAFTLQHPTASTFVYIFYIHATMRLSSLVVLGKALALISLLAPVLAADLALKTPTREGCFESSDPLEDHGSDLYQSSGACQKQCVELGKPVMGMTKGTNCWCGDFIPVADSKVSDSKCSSPCAGYDKENCTSGSIPGPPGRALTHI